MSHSTKAANDLAVDFKAEMLTSLQKQNEQLKQQIEQLKYQLTQKSLEYTPSSEEMVCIEQIEVLRNRSMGRELSLEEVKKLDLLVKNLRLIKEQSSENADNAKWRDVSVSEEALVAIASKSES